MTEVITTIAAMRAWCDARRAEGGVVGVVPTMGYLHEGHCSLMRAARAGTDAVVVTIFVNPMQFGPSEDLDQYPRDLEADLAACAREGVDVVFAPDTAEMYPTYPQATTVAVTGLTDALCGAHRAGHFDGVTTVVAKLFAIIGPSRAYFGRKDAQQLAVVARMTADLNLPVEVIGCPLVRETDGLARSSRNAYLTPEQRQVAPAVFAALRAGLAAVQSGERDPAAVVAVVHAALRAAPDLDPQYVELRDAATIGPVERVEGTLLLAVAAFLGSTRLIDNLHIEVADGAVTADLGVGWDGSQWRPPAGPA